jgi:hypothetical protein
MLPAFLNLTQFAPRAKLTSPEAFENQYVEAEPLLVDGRERLERGQFRTGASCAPARLLAGRHQFEFVGLESLHGDQIEE